MPSTNITTALRGLTRTVLDRNRLDELELATRVHVATAEAIRYSRGLTARAAETTRRGLVQRINDLTRELADE